MADATNSTPGSIKLAGDLTGNANAPELRNTGVVPGSYEKATVIVDPKGRVAGANSISSVYPVAGDITGNISATVLGTTGVVPDSYTFTGLTVNEDGFITAASSGSTVLSGDVEGSFSASTLIPTAVTPNSYTYTSLTVDSKGRITSASNGTPITFGGDITGTPSVSVLSDTAVTPNSYTYTSLTVDSKGRITSATTVNPPNTSTTVKGILQVTANTGLTLSSGALSGTLANSTTTLGVVRSLDVNNITITSGNIDVGPNIPTLVTSNTFQKAQRVTASVNAGSFTPNLDNTDVFTVNAVSPAPTVSYPDNALIGQSFNIMGNWDTAGQTWTTRSISSGRYYSVVWSGTKFCAVGNASTGSPPGGQSSTSTDGNTWSQGTMPNSDKWFGVAWNGTVFCAVADSNSSSNATNSAATSADGLSWTIRTLPATSFWRGIAWNGTVFCAVTTTNSATSTNGVSWTLGTAPGGTLSDGVASNGTLFTTGRFYSNGGLTWTACTGDLASRPYWDGSKFIALSVSGNQVSTSTDGISWTAATGTLPATPNNQITVASAGAKFVVMGYQSGSASTSAAYSLDSGTTWSNATIPSQLWNCVVHNGTRFQAVGSSPGAVSASSQDGALSFPSNYKFSNTYTFPTYNLQCTVGSGGNIYCTYL